LYFIIFLKYVKDLCIIVIKNKSLTIQTTHSDERPRRSTVDLSSKQIQISILHKWYITELRSAHSYSVILEERAMVRAALLPSLLLVVGNNSSRAATWLDVKFPVKMASYARLDVDEVGVACDRVPILFMRSTSPRLEVGTCASG
jgi:hypothetical protein